MKKSKSRIINIILVCLLFAAIIYIIFILRQCSPSNNQVSNLQADNEAVDYDGDHTTARLVNGQPGIVVPGFKSLAFLADQKHQSVNFYNPESNDCLFKMSLIINDYTYWQSAWVEPGKGYYDIELSESLSKGKYAGTLNIECRRKDNTPLNGATVQFDLEVI